MNELTYKKLKQLLSDNGLIAGEKYAVIDYKPTYIGPNFVMLGHSFDVIVTAASNNELSSQALFKKHAGDAYFSDNKLEE